MKLFITGAESFVAKELIRQCSEKDIEFVGVDIVESQNPCIYKADITKINIAELIPNNVDAIIHLAALSSDFNCKNNAIDCFNINVMGTLNLINAALKTNTRQFIFASTEWVYESFDINQSKTENSSINIANITSEYALSKLVSEANLRQQYQHGFCSITILRFGIIYGPRGPRKTNWSAVESLLSTMKHKNEITVGSLMTARNFIHLSDIASGIIKSVGLPNFNILNIQGDALISLENIIETGQNILNKKIRVSEKDPKNPSIKNISNSLAKKLLNWSPQIDLKMGLKSIVQFV